MKWGNIQGLVNGTEKVVFDHEVLAGETATKLLIHFNGADAATSYTAETGQTVTFGGGAQLDTAQQKFGTASLLLDGSGDYVTVPDSADWAFGNGEFTIDFWIRFSNATPDQSLVSQWYAGNKSFNLLYDGPSAVTFYYTTDGTTEQNVGFSWAPSANVWYHVALVRAGDTLSLYVDGTSIGSGSLAGKTLYNSTGLLNIGADGGASNFAYGWFDEVRISKGVARWTANFTPDTSEYAVTNALLHMDGVNEGVTFPEMTGKTVTNTETYDSYTKLLLHLNGSFVDYSASSHAMTNNGSVGFSSTIKKFGDYSAGAFNGSSQYLSTPDHADWNLGNTFTVDCWMNWTVATDSNFYDHLNAADGNDGMSMFYTANTITVALRAASAYTLIFTAPFTPVVGTWYHIAVVRIDGTNAATAWRVFINGVSQTLTLGSGAWNAAVPDSTGLLKIGYSSTFLGYHNGYFDEYRVSNGIARWTADFTPYRSAYGRVATITADKKFGASSAEFKGSGDILTLADHADWAFGSGDFTIDFWVKFNVVAGACFIAQQQDSSNRMYFDWNPNSLRFYIQDGGTVRGAWNRSWTPSVDTWYHLAVVRSGSNGYIFVDGSSTGTTQETAWGTWADITGNLEIGRYPSGVEYLNGEIDELRITKGTARWTADFTPPTAAYNDGPVSLITTGDILNGNEDGWYTVIALINGSGNDTTIAMRPNNDNGANYGVLKINATNTTVTGPSQTAMTYWPEIAYCDTAGNIGFGVLKFYAKSGAARLGNCTNIYGVTGTTVGLLANTASVWNNTTDNITSLCFVDYNGNARIGPGTRIIVLKSNNFTGGTPTGVITSPYIKGSWVRVGSQTVGSSTNSVIFSDLNGNRDVLYRLIVSAVNGGAPNTNISVRINNDGGSNYGDQFLGAQDTTVSASRTTSYTLMYIIDGMNGLGVRGHGEMLLFAKAGFVRPTLANEAFTVSGTTVTGIISRGWVWNNVSANITSLNIASSQVSGIGAGTQIDLYALRPNG